jgi:hypothetical protein
MRTLFFLLLLANVALIAFGRFGDVLFPGESQLLQQQINPGAIKLLTPAQVARSAAARRDKTVTCLEWGGFAVAEAGRADQALAPLAALAPGTRVAQRGVSEITTWWVFVPPQGSRQAAMVKAGELKSLGIEDYFVLQEDSKFRFAISLGVFRTQDAARNRLEQLRAKGVRSAQVGARDTQPETIWFQVRNFPQGVAAKLNELRKEFPGSELRDCPAEEKG